MKTYDGMLEEGDAEGSSGMAKGDAKSAPKGSAKGCEAMRTFNGTHEDTCYN